MGTWTKVHGNGGREERTDPSSIQEDTLTGLGAGVEEKGENEGQMSYLGDDTHDSAIIQVITEKEKEMWEVGWWIKGWNVDRGVPVDHQVEMSSPDVDIPVASPNGLGRSTCNHEINLEVLGTQGSCLLACLPHCLIYSPKYLETLLTLLGKETHRWIKTDMVSVLV